MNTTLDELAFLRRGQLPPALGGKLHALAAQLEQVGAFGDFTEALGGRSTGMSSAQRAAAVRQDLSHGRVIPIDGQIRLEDVAFGRRGWRFHSAVPELVWSDLVFLKPLPGPWRVYALPSSWVIVGAEAYGGAAESPGSPTAAHVQAYAATLAAAQGLDAFSLRELRQGRLPPVARHREAAAFWGKLGIVALVLLGSVVMFGASFLPGGPILVHAYGYDLGITLLGVPLCWLMALSLLVRAVRFKLSASSRVAVVSGLARAYRSQTGKTVAYHLHVEGAHFTSVHHPLVKDLWYAVVDGAPVRAYVAAGTGMLVGVEPLGG